MKVCPICEREFDDNLIEAHVNQCLDIHDRPNRPARTESMMTCPICQLNYPASKIQRHANQCLSQMNRASRLSNLPTATPIAFSTPMVEVDSPLTTKVPTNKTTPRNNHHSTRGQNHVNQNPVNSTNPAVTISTAPMLLTFSSNSIRHPQNRSRDHSDPPVPSPISSPVVSSSNSPQSTIQGIIPPEIRLEGLKERAKIDVLQKRIMELRFGY